MGFPLKFIINAVVTLLLWTYYTLGYIVFFSPFYLLAFIFSGDREIAFQRLNHLFYKGFFFLARVIIPRQKWRIQNEVLSIRSSVIVCNHLSYLDPILLISLFEKQKTIVKSIFFKLPIFGWVLKTSGYIPSSMEHGEFALLTINNVENMEDYLLSGGNLFVFPEGTRSRDTRIGRFNKGAFSIARRCNAPIKVLLIKNTNLLFQPGKFLFNTCVQNTIEVELIATIKPDYKSNAFSISSLMTEVRSLFENQQKTDQ